MHAASASPVHTLTEPQPLQPCCTPLPTLPQVSEAAAATRAAGGGASATLFFSQPTPDAVTAVLTMPHARWAAAGLADGAAGAEAYRALLAASFPTLPPQWAEAVSTAEEAGRQALLQA